MLASVLALLVAMALAWWSWRDRFDRPLARWAMLARAAGLLALLLLLLDPGLASRRLDSRPLVLLDNSVSMHAAAGRAVEAAKLAASLGDTTAFGELSAGEPGGRSNLFDVLTGAVSSGRIVTIVSDGEIGDAAAIPADLLAQATVRVLPRSAGEDIALTEIQAPLRITAGDTLMLDVEGTRTSGAPDTAAIVVRDSATILLHGTLRFGGGAHARLHLAGALPRSLQGAQWLRIERVGPADAEPGDDIRWWQLSITPTPGVVVIAESPDWDARALYRTLKDVVEVPIRGYVQLQHGQWRRMDDLRVVAATEVLAAARSADLLAVRGDSRAWHGLGRARLAWPGATQSGDWYVNAGGVSPVSAALVGVEADSLPAVAGVRPLDSVSARGWTGATARLSRRGAPVPVVAGVDDRSGRSVTIGVDGLYRWALHGGVPDQAWRTMIASAASWLLAMPEGDSLRARPVVPVTQRGRAMHFHWTGGGVPTPVAIELRGARGVRIDTLRFDGTGDALLALAVGRYRYTLEGGGAGSIAVEPYSDELVRSAPTLQDRTGVSVRTAPRRSLRELVWLFAIAIAGFGTEWMLRRRLGLR